MLLPTSHRRRTPSARLLPLLAGLALLAAVLPATAAAATVHLAADTFSVREDAGSVTVTVVRSSPRGKGAVRYGVWPTRSAQPRREYGPVKGRLDFAEGQRTATFRIPIYDDDDVEVTETARIQLFGAHPMRLVEPSRATLRILDDDRIGTERDAANPLGLDPPPPRHNPLHGARFFVDEEWGMANQVSRALRKRDPAAAAKLRVIADQPETKRFGRWNANPRRDVAGYLQRAKEADPGAIPLLSTYRLKHVSCGGYSDSRKEAASYKRWYEQFAQGIGNHRVVLFYEIDALITAKCLSRRGVKVRIGQMRHAIDALARLPRAVVYVDAGASDAHTPRFYARLLRRVGVHKIQGFFTNSTHQMRTKPEIRFARTVVKLLGGRPHYVVNTATNGQGPFVPRGQPRRGKAWRCNPPGRGLGPRPTADVPRRFRNLDALIWIGNPGRSSGCAAAADAPPAGSFWVRYALELIAHANFRIT